MMRMLSVIMLALATAGCDTLPKRVEIPVAVPCRVDMPAKPAWATQALSKDADIFDQVKALLAERRQRQGYEQLLQAAIDGCNATSPTTGNVLVR